MVHCGFCLQSLKALFFIQNTDNSLFGAKYKKEKHESIFKLLLDGKSRMFAVNAAKSLVFRGGCVLKTFRFQRVKQELF